MNLTETIRNTIERHGLIPSGAPVVAGVSGGADSIALLHALHALGTPVTIAHLNHQLRGEASDGDEALVRQLAEQLDLPIAVKSVDVSALARSEGISVEMAARQARHAFFAELEPTVVALAHHADDQVETFFLRLTRGAGTDGLGGMAYSQAIGQIRLIRPMLDVTRSEIRDWLKENGIAWREDASNSDEKHLRNRVRHTVLPMLERELNPNLRQAILRTMNILREEGEWMDATIADCPLAMTDLPLAAKRRALRQWLFGQGAEEVSFDAVDRILAQMARGEGTTVHELNVRQRVVVEYGVPRFEDTPPSQDIAGWTLTIEAGRGWKKDEADRIGRLPAEASFNAAKVGDAPITVRAFREGDRMAPLGMEGSRKLQDIFTDLKLPRSLRTQVPVVVCRGEIIWLPGYRIALGWQVPDAQGESVHVRIEHNAAR